MELENDEVFNAWLMLFDKLKIKERSDNELLNLLTRKWMEFFVSPGGYANYDVNRTINLRLLQSCLNKYSANEQNFIVSNITRINDFIANGQVYYLQYKQQTINDLFEYEGHSKKKVDPITDVSMSSSFFWFF